MGAVTELIVGADQKMVFIGLSLFDLTGWGIGLGS